MAMVRAMVPKRVLWWYMMWMAQPLRLMAAHKLWAI